MNFMLRFNQYKKLFLQRKKDLSSRIWYPQVPLSIAVALIGLMYLLPLLNHKLGWQFVSAYSSLNLDSFTLWGVSQSTVGILLLVMSLGLLWRSRIAWATCVFAIFIGVLVQCRLAESAGHWWRIAFDGVLLLVLLPAYDRFDRHSIALGTLFALASLSIYMGFAVFGTYHIGDQFSPAINDLTTALYFVVVTVSSVGYGDITPSTMEARMFLMSTIILGIAVVSTAVGATLVPAFINRIEKITVKREMSMERREHYIIVGFTSLASNTYRELTERGEQVTVILFSAAEADSPKFADIDVVVGDASDVNTLKKAGGEEAKAILALLNDDSENAFVVLAAKELEGGIKRVAAVNDVKNMSRIRKVHPYLVIAPQVLGSELLTMALTGEKVDSSTIMQRLMGQAKLASGKGKK
jgi:voltage-gated potassium channel